MVEQGLPSSEHFNLCCTVSSSTLHWQVVFVAGSTKPHFFSSVLVLATSVRKWLRHRPTVHLEFDLGGSFFSGVMFKRMLCGSAVSFCFHASSLKVEIFSFRSSARCRKLLLDSNLERHLLSKNHKPGFWMGLPSGY